MPATMERFTSAGRPVTAEVFLPKTSKRCPAVLILHGTFGLDARYKADIVSFADAIVDRKMVAVIPHYFERTATLAGPGALAAMPTHLPAWSAACRDALSFMRGHASVDAGRFGVIGFSLGGHLALGLGITPPTGTTLKCAVDFFGPTLMPPLVGDVAALPPVQIHHGTADTLVPLDHSLHLVNELRAVGRTSGLGYELLTYPGQGHGFTGADLSTARQRTVAFLETAL